MTDSQLIRGSHYLLMCRSSLRRTTLESLCLNYTIGVAFKKTFSYAGFEQQPKHLKDPPILLLNVELELK